MFWDRSEVGPLPGTLREHLVRARGLSPETTEKLRMMQKRGRYSGRTVTFFVIFDPTGADLAAAEVRHHDDLAPELILFTGHLEGDGQIMLNAGPSDEQ